MSEEAHAGRHWRFYIQDMIDFSEKVLAYTDGMDLESFLADELRYDATLRNLKLIGEAATPHSATGPPGSRRDSPGARSSGRAIVLPMPT